MAAPAVLQRLTKKDTTDQIFVSHYASTSATAVFLLLPQIPVAIRFNRKFLASGFFLTLIPLIYFYISHSVHRVPGAYSSYAIFEWALVAWDVGFDALGASLEEVKRMKVGVLFFDAGTEVDGWVGDKDVPLDRYAYV